MSARSLAGIRTTTAPQINALINTGMESDDVKEYLDKLYKSVADIPTRDSVSEEIAGQSGGILVNGDE